MDAPSRRSAKRVIVHVGFPKTGSSALQAFLSSNIAELERHGVSYPYPEPASIVALGGCTGNLVQILYRDGFVEDYLRGSENNRLRLSQVMSVTYFERLISIIEGSKNRIIIFSSEVFPMISPEAMDFFRKNIREKYETKIIGFVRDPFDYAYSSWRQRLKRQAISLPFADFVKSDADQSGAAMKGFVKLTEAGLRPTLLNYDTYKENIVGTFLEAAEIPFPRSAEYRLSGNQHNSSLTDAEAVVVQMASARFPGGDFPATLSKLLMKRPTAERHSSGFYSREIHEHILSRHRAVIEEINRGIVGEKLSTTVRSQADVSPVVGSGELACLVEALSIALRQRPESKMRPSVFARAKSLFRPKGNALPPDFNAEAYLFHNPDVAMAGVDPVNHYLSNGRVEQRRYRYS